MIIEQLSRAATADALSTSAVAGRVELEGVGLLVLHDGRILVNEPTQRCTVRGSTREAHTLHQLARIGALGQRLRSRGLLGTRASA